MTSTTKDDWIIGIGVLATPFCRIGVSRCSTHECGNFHIIKPLGIITLSKLWWKFQPHVMFYMSLGNITLSMLWLKFQPQVRFCKLLGMIEIITKGQALEAAEQTYIVYALVKLDAEGQAAQAEW